MKNLIKWFGIIAFVAIIGFSFVSCGSMGETFANSLNTTTETQKDELDGTIWIASNGMRITFNTPNFSASFGSGKYSVSTTSSGNLALTFRLDGNPTPEHGVISGNTLTTNSREYTKQ